MKIHLRKIVNKIKFNSSNISGFRLTTIIIIIIKFKHIKHNIIVTFIYNLKKKYINNKLNIYIS